MEHQHKSSTPLRAKDIIAPSDIYIYVFLFIKNNESVLQFIFFVFRLCYRLL